MANKFHSVRTANGSFEITDTRYETFPLIDTKHERFQDRGFGFKAVYIVSSMRRAKIHFRSK
jgi:hypothetical protein